MEPKKVGALHVIVMILVFALCTQPLWGSATHSWYYNPGPEVTRVAIDEFTGTFSAGGTDDFTMKSGFDIDDFRWFYSYTDGYDYTAPIKFISRSGNVCTIEGDASKNYQIRIYDWWHE